MGAGPARAIFAVGKTAAPTALRDSSFRDYAGPSLCCLFETTGPAIATAFLKDPRRAHLLEALSLRYGDPPSLQSASAPGHFPSFCLNCYKPRKIMAGLRNNPGSPAEGMVMLGAMFGSAIGLTITTGSFARPRTG